MAYIDNPNVTLDWAKSFKRTGNFPLDYSSIFASYDDAVAYAKLDGTDSRSLGKTGYVGQIIVVYSEEEVAAYLIVAAGQLMKLAETDPDASNPDDAIASLKTQLQGVADRVTALEGKDSPTREEFTTLSGKVDNNTTNISGVTDRVGVLEGKITGLTGAMHFKGISSTDPTTGVTVDGVESFESGDVVLFETKEFVYNGTSWVELGDEGSHLTKTEAANTYATKEALSSEQTAREEGDTALDGRISAIEGAGYVSKETADATYVAKESDKELIPSADLTKLQGMAEIKSVSSEFNIDESKQLSVVAIEQSKVTGLSDALAAKADQTTVDGIDERLSTAEGAIEAINAAAENYATKEELSTAKDEITAAVGEGYVAKEEGKSLVKDEDITKLEGLANIKSVDETSITLSGEGVLSVKAVDKSIVTGLQDELDKKADKTDLDTLSGLVGTKDDTKEDDTAFGRIAKVKEDLATEVGDSIKNVKVNGVALEKSANEVNIPVASAEALGVVKSAEGENKVSVDGEGVMSVASVNANTLVQTDGEYLTLDGGNAGLTSDQD